MMRRWMISLTILGMLAILQSVPAQALDIPCPPKATGAQGFVEKMAADFSFARKLVDAIRDNQQIVDFLKSLLHVDLQQLKQNKQEAQQIKSELKNLKQEAEAAEAKCGL